MTPSEAGPPMFEGANGPPACSPHAAAETMHSIAKIFRSKGYPGLL